jgi:hypothetical protein
MEWDQVFFPSWQDVLCYHVFGITLYPGTIQKLCSQSTKHHMVVTTLALKIERDDY